MSLEKLEQEMRACTKCASTLSNYGIQPRPIFSGGLGFPIFLLGQAPGIDEYKNGLPFQGDAGQSIKRLFSAHGLNHFDRVVYQTSVTKCFPGRRMGSSVDRGPSVLEQRNCASFLSRQLVLAGLKKRVLCRAQHNTRFLNPVYTRTLCVRGLGCRSGPLST